MKGRLIWLALLLCPAILRAQIYVASDPSQGIVGEYSTSGAPINAALITGLTQPFAITADSAGNLYVADYLDGRVGKYSSSGATINKTLFSYARPDGLACDGQGNLYVSGELNQVGVFTTSGAPVNPAFITNGLYSPQGVAYHDGNVYVLDGSDNVYIYSTSGPRLADIPADAGARGIAFDNAGHMFVPRQAAGAIALYTSSGTLLNANLITGT